MADLADEGPTTLSRGVEALRPTNSFVPVASCQGRSAGSTSWRFLVFFLAITRIGNHLDRASRSPLPQRDGGVIESSISVTCGLGSGQSCVESQPGACKW